MLATSNKLLVFNINYIGGSISSRFVLIETKIDTVLVCAKGYMQDFRIDIKAILIFDNIGYVNI